MSDILYGNERKVAKFEQSPIETVVKLPESAQSSAGAVMSNAATINYSYHGLDASCALMVNVYQRHCS